MAVVLLSACSANNVAQRQTDAQKRAAAAQAATKDLAQATSKDPGCGHIVTSEESRATPAPEYQVLLTDAVAVAEPCWDKITFTFLPTGDDMPPGYQVEYRKPPFVEGPSDSPVETLGDAFLFVTFTPASQTDARDPGRPKQMYLGNLRLRLDGMHHTQIVRKLIDGDGTVMWVIGLDQKRPFTVDAANQPPRVSIYIMK
jgi:hypothetical protein